MMIITTEGTIIRIKVSATALLGRITSGVKLINLKDGVEVASIEIVRGENKDSEDEATEIEVSNVTDESIDEISEESEDENK